MALKSFSIASLADIKGGRLASALEEEMKMAIADVRNRPSDERARKVSLLILFKPQEVEEGTADVESVNVEFELKHALPSRSIGINMSVKQNGKLLWNDMATDNVQQKTIDEAGD